MSFNSILYDAYSYLNSKSCDYDDIYMTIIPTLVDILDYDSLDVNILKKFNISIMSDVIMRYYLSNNRINDNIKKYIDMISTTYINCDDDVNADDLYDYYYRGTFIYIMIINGYVDNNLFDQLVYDKNQLCVDICNYLPDIGKHCDIFYDTLVNRNIMSKKEFISRFFSIVKFIPNIFDEDETLGNDILDFCNKNFSTSNIINFLEKCVNREELQFDKDKSYEHFYFRNFIEHINGPYGNLRSIDNRRVINCLSSIFTNTDIGDLYGYSLIHLPQNRCNHTTLKVKGYFFWLYRKL